MKYRKKETINAVQYRGEENMDEVITLVGDRLRYWPEAGVMTLMTTAKRSATLIHGDYIVRSEGRRGLPPTFKIVPVRAFTREYEEA